MNHNKSKLKILITGACGVTSRSVVRSLMLSDKFKNSIFIGVDICNNLYGIFEGLYNKIYRVPICNNTNYRKIVNIILKNEKIDVAIVIPELEVLYWAENPFNVNSFLPPALFSKQVISKRKLYEILSGKNLVPQYEIIDKKSVLFNDFINSFPYPIWVRDYSAGSTSGKGSYMASNLEQLKAWIIINNKTNDFLISEYLPGRNYGCFLLFNNGKLLKVGIAERIEYLMNKISVSGITGNTSRGKLINRRLVQTTALGAVERVCKSTGEIMSGLVVVDLKENMSGKPLVTEINIRHVAFTSCFAMAGFNFSEFQLLCALKRENEIDSILEKKYPKNNLILRDVDGIPIFIEDYKSLKIGESY